MSDGRDLVAFRVSGRRLALPLDQVGAVVPVPHLAAPVGAPSFVEGFFDLHGREVAVLRADSLLELGEEPLGIYAPLLLLRSPAALALHVAAVEGIIRSAVIRPLGRDETFNGCVVGRFDQAGRPAYVLSAERILAAEEQARVAFLRAASERRRARVHPREVPEDNRAA